MQLLPPRLWKTERVTVQTAQFVMVRLQSVTRCWCSECGQESEFVSADAVDQVLRLGGGRDRDDPPADQIHFRKAADGSVVVCMKSLSGL